VPDRVGRAIGVAIGWWPSFGIASGVVVDTHVQRIARRLDLTKETDPGKIEVAREAGRSVMSLVARGHRRVQERARSRPAPGDGAADAGPGHRRRLRAAGGEGGLDV